MKQLFELKKYEVTMLFTNKTLPTLVKPVSAIALALSLITTTACSKQADESHGEHAEHEHEAHDHEHEHEHEEHSHDEHAEHEGHDHAHGTGAEQVIPEGYSVNFAVSNHPMFLLSEVVTAGTPTTVKKLLGAGDVGHHGSLSPSDMKTVEDSEYVLWFGDSLESNLAKTLNSSDNAMAMLDLQDVALLNRRDEQAKTIENTQDPHIWSSPVNAKLIVNKLAELHSKVNPGYAEQYQANVKEFANNIDKLVTEQKAKVGEHNQYWSSHDAFQYFEKTLGIELAGTLTTDHEVPAKASQIVWLNQNRPYATMCLLSQSPAKEGIKTKLAPVTNAVLIEDMSDSDNYLEAWKNESQKIIDCINSSK